MSSKHTMRPKVVRGRRDSAPHPLPALNAHLSNEAIALLTESERVGMWASAVFEAYLQGDLFRPSGRGQRVELDFDTKVAVWDATNGICAYCGHAMHPFRTFTIDHFVPLANGGVGHLPNLVPACVGCNGSKRDKLPENFFVGRMPSLTWMAEAAIAYYKAVLKLERLGLATFDGPPLWLTQGLVELPVEPVPFARRKRKPKEETG